MPFGPVLLAVVGVKGPLTLGSMMGGRLPVEEIELPPSWAAASACDEPSGAGFWPESLIEMPPELDGVAGLPPSGEVAAPFAGAAPEPPALFDIPPVGCASVGPPSPIVMAEV